MNRLTIKLVLVLGCVALICAVFSQANQLANLREDQKKLLSALSTSTAVEMSLEATGTHASEPSETTPNELLRLRNEVNQLTRQKRELASVASENGRLRAQLASAATNTQGSLPSGYIRKTTARNAGFATPAATLETFLWAAQNEDENVFLDALSPEAAKNIRSGGRPMRDMFKDVNQMPGFQIVDTRRSGADQVTVLLEFVPGVEPAPMQLKQIAGQWKVMFDR